MAVPYPEPRDDARLLPRYRHASVLLDRLRLVRAQSKVLMQALDENPDGQLPLRHALTKPGDELALRGIPAIGRNVGGVVRGTQPEQETIARISRQERINERTTA